MAQKFSHYLWRLSTTQSTYQMTSGLEFIYQSATIQGDSLQDGRMTHGQNTENKLDLWFCLKIMGFPSCAMFELFCAVARQSVMTARSKWEHRWFSARQVQIKILLVHHFKQTHCFCLQKCSLCQRREEFPCRAIIQNYSSSPQETVRQPKNNSYICLLTILSGPGFKFPVHTHFASI